jgi:hypothetical protein
MACIVLNAVFLSSLLDLKMEAIRFSELHGVTTQMIVLFLVTAVGTSDPSVI